MQLAIITASQAPLRAEKSGASEMISQLYFGEAVEILSTEDTWVHIRNLFDNYTGWTDIRLMEKIQSHQPEELLTGKHSVALVLPVLRQDRYGTQVQMLGLNSFFPDCLIHSEDDGVLTYRLGAVSIDIGEDSISTPKPFSRENILNAASDYLNTPYLWGGRTSMGIDCSGLVQTCFRTCGINLPRDARDQVHSGKNVTIETAGEGDIAFFSNSDGRIIHTGICTGEGDIIHASGYVKTDTLSPEGIYDLQLEKITHKLACIKSWFDD